MLEKNMAHIQQKTVNLISLIDVENIYVKPMKIRVNNCFQTLIKKSIYAFVTASIHFESCMPGCSFGYIQANEF